MGYRIQGAGGVQGELVLLRVYVELHDCALPTLHPKHSNARGAIIRVNGSRLHGAVVGPRWLHGAVVGPRWLGVGLRLVLAGCMEHWRAQDGAPNRVLLGHEGESQGHV